MINILRYTGESQKIIIKHGWNSSNSLFDSLANEKNEIVSEKFQTQRPEPFRNLFTKSNSLRNHPNTDFKFLSQHSGKQKNFQRRKNLFTLLLTRQM